MYPIMNSPAESVQMFYSDNKLHRAYIVKCILNVLELKVCWNYMKYQFILATFFDKIWYLPISEKTNRDLGSVGYTVLIKYLTTRVTTYP
jgi:hypothetical protein